MTPGIFQVRCLVDNRTYVGAARNLGTIMAALHYNLRHGVHGGRPLQDAFHQYGDAFFVFEVIKTVSFSDIDLLPIYKALVIAALNEQGTPLYNQRVKTYLKSDDTRAKMRAAHLGSTHSPEVRRKISLAHRGKTSSIGTLKEIHAPWLQRDLIIKHE